MLAVVKAPHTKAVEISLAGGNAEVMELLELLRSRFEVNVLTPAANDGDESVDVFETDFWKETTPGDLLMGCRLKHDLTQEQLAEKSGINRVMISDYEQGKRKLTMKAALKLGVAMGEEPKKFFMK